MATKKSQQLIIMNECECLFNQGINQSLNWSLIRLTLPNFQKDQVILLLNHNGML